MRQRRKGRLTAHDGFDRRGCLNNLLAHAAAIFMPDRPHDAPCDGGDIELLGAVNVQPAQRPAAIRAGADAAGGFHDDFVARQMIGQRAHRDRALGLGLGLGLRRRGRERGDDRCGFEFFECQLKLRDLGAQLLG